MSFLSFPCVSWVSCSFPIVCVCVCVCLPWVWLPPPGLISSNFNHIIRSFLLKHPGFPLSGCQIISPFPAVLRLSASLGFSITLVLHIVFDFLLTPVPSAQDSRACTPAEPLRPPRRSACTHPISDPSIKPITFTRHSRPRVGRDRTLTL